MSTNKNSNSEKDELLDIFPGRTIELETNGKSLRVTIRPMAIMHMRKFKQSITKALEKVGKVYKDGDKNNTIQNLLPCVADIVTEDLLDIVNECVDGIDLVSVNCPTWIYPIVVQEWILESFGSEKKIRPWVNLLEDMTQKTTGKKMDLWAMLTSSLYRADGQNTK